MLGATDPRFPTPDFCYAAAKLALGQGQYPLAANLFEEYVRSVPDSPGAHRKLGFCRFEMGDFEGAAAALERSAALRPDHLQSQVMLGMALHATGRPEEGLSTLQRALTLLPTTALERVMRGQLRVLFGDWIGGWLDMESKWVAPQLRDGLTFRPSPEAPLWDGASMPDSTLCVHAETGRGDNIMFSRFLPLASSRVGRLVLVAPLGLERLFLRVPGVDAVIENDAVPGDAVHTSIWSLPAALGLTIEAMPAPRSYLIPPSSGPELGKPSGPRVGLVWAGGPGPAHDRDRSCPSIELLRPLLQVEGLEWISLQVGSRASEANALGILPMPPVADFADTAYIISQLDLVITVDTSVAHLSGALGVPTWVMVPTMPEFRWLLDREDNPWYPKARLFRRRHTREWAEMIGRVRDELVVWTKGKITSAKPEGETPDARGSVEPSADGGISPEAGYLLGKAAMDRGQHLLAAALFDDYVTGDPNAGPAYRRLGYCRFMLGEYERTVDALRRAVEIRPEHIQSIVMLGMALHTIGSADEGRRAFERALSLEAVTDLQRTMCGQIRLLFGDFARGWAEYEARWTAPQLTGTLPFQPSADRPLWDGSPAPDRTLCVVSEGGFGDVIMFSRFLSLIAPRVGRVVVLVAPPLERLLRGVTGISDVLTRHDAVPPGALYTSSWSLAAHLPTTVEALSQTVPYLSPPAEGPSLGARRLPRVGLVWAGGDHTTHNHDRSISDPELLRPLLEVRGVEWISLQVGPRSAEGERLSIRGLPAVEDFADTAFVVSQLDLVISVDTAVAHLAGALGIPTWIMIPTIPEFRWFLDREDSPWYPTARLFRRKHTRAWPDIIETMRIELERWVASARR